jgi:phage head maturation protease
VTPSWQLGGLRANQQLSRGLIICRVGSSGSLALVEPSNNADVGTGRTLSGTATVFDQWNEVRDQEGHYLERISPRAFVKTLSENGGRIPLLLDHGRHPQLGSMLLGQLRSVTADASGLQYTAELHQGLPELLREGLAAGQYGSSFRARVVKSSTEPRPPASPFNPDRLPQVTRKELQLLDLGPTALPAYAATSARLRSAAPRPRLEIVHEEEKPSWYLGDLRDDLEPSWQLRGRKEKHGRTYAKN